MAPGPAGPTQTWHLYATAIMSVRPGPLPGSGPQRSDREKSVVNSPVQIYIVYLAYTYNSQYRHNEVIMIFAF